MSQRYSEDELIAKLFKPIAGPLGGFLDDDAAFLPLPHDGGYVVTTDALVAGVHFFEDDPPALIAKKALRVNLSDLAAKGASPLVFTLTLCLPPDWTNAWLEAFASGLKEDVEKYHCRLIGGDTTATPGPLMISVTALGFAEKKIYISRSGARPGDVIYVSGPIGDAALGLAVRRDPELAKRLSDRARDHLLERYLLPNPRLDLVRTIRAHASAAMDISDGLAGDAAKLCRASKVSAIVDLPLVPLSDAAREAIALEPTLFETAMTGGDDYEILFAAGEGFTPPSGVVCIGEIVAGEAFPQFRDDDKNPINFKKLSFQHF
jgi:thiamine-monophosphate kinase